MQVIRRFTSGTRRGRVVQGKVGDKHGYPSSLGRIPAPPYAASKSASPPMEMPALFLRGTEEEEALRNASRLAASVLSLGLQMVEEADHALTSAEIDAALVKTIVDNGAYPSPLNYAGFPRGVCISTNEVLCHGIPDDSLLEKGDVVAIDVSVFVDGVHGDTCGSAVVGGKGGEGEGRGERLVEVANRALELGIGVAGPGVPFYKIGEVIQGYVEDEEGMSVSPHFCGHGIGVHFHTLPVVEHVRNFNAVEMEVGMAFTIEPIVAEGVADDIVFWDDGWTAVTVDGSWSAQAEHTVLVVEGGVDVLTGRSAL